MKISEAKLRQIISEEMLKELMGPTNGDDSRTASTDQPFLDNVPSPFEWWKNATDYWGNTEDSPGIEAFHKTLNGLEMIPLVNIPAGIMNAFIHHARGDNTRALMSLGFAATGGLAAAGLKSAIKAPGAAQKIFASLGNAGRKLAGQLKGYNFTILLRNPDAAQAALRSILAFSPAAGELVEEELAQTFIEVDKEVQDGDRAWKKIQQFRMKKVPLRIPHPSGKGVRDYDKQMSFDTVTEAVISRLLSEQPYKTPGQEYTALFLDQQSRDKLTDTLDDPPPGWALYADHMTLKFGSEGVPERYLGPAQCKVVGVALNDRVMAARVETDIPTQNDIPHITIATAPGAKPRESNDFSLDDFDDVDTIALKGEVRPKFREELQKKRPGI